MGVVSDPRLQWTMLVKIIDLKMLELQNARQRRNEGSAERSGAERLEVIHRLFASARRDFDGAVIRFLRLFGA